VHNHSGAHKNGSLSYDGNNLKLSRDGNNVFQGKSPATGSKKSAVISSSLLSANSNTSS